MKKVNYKVLGKNIKRVRTNRGLTQEQVAEYIDIATSHMSNIETAKTKVSLDKLVKIANYLETSIDLLLLDLHNEESMEKEKGKEDFKEMEILIDTCDEQEREIVLEMMVSLIESFRKRKKN